MDIVQRLATYQIVRGSVSTKNDNSFITRRNSYNIIVSHLYAYALLVNRAILRAHETASDEGSGIGRYNTLAEETKDRSVFHDRSAIAAVRGRWAVTKTAIVNAKNSSLRALATPRT